MINAMQMRHSIGKPLPKKNEVKRIVDKIEYWTEQEVYDPDKCLKEISKICEEAKIKGEIQ